MARCTFGPLVANVVGTLGAVTFKGRSCSGILTLKRRMPPPPTQAQLTSQAVHRKHLWWWDTLISQDQALWNNFGRALFRTDAIGRRHYLTGKQAWMLYAARVDPLAGVDFTTWTLPVGGVCRTPVITSVSFTAGGPCNIVVSNWDTDIATEILWVNRWMQYGPRNSGNRHVCCGYANRTGDTLNWYSTMAAFGVTLNANEQIRLYI